MPLKPEFIPISKGRQMFAMSSWRDTNTAGSGTGLSSTPGGGPAARHSPSLSSLRVKEVDLPSPTDPLPPSMDSAAAVEGAAAGGSSKRSKRERRSAAKSAAAAAVPPADVIDYLLYLTVPTSAAGVPVGVVPEALEMEIKAQATPLRVVKTGLVRVLFARRPPSAPAASSAGADGEKPKPAAAAGPFQTPALLPADDPASVAAAAATPSDPNSTAPTDYQIVVLLAESAEAQKLESFIHLRYPTIGTHIVPRVRSLLNASLVIKGLPSFHKSESVLQEVEHHLPQHPSYVRLHRSERGVFKNVVFIKYANRSIAESAKLSLERFYLGAKPLKVEFKKKSKPIEPPQPSTAVAAAVTPTKTGGRHSTSVSPMLGAVGNSPQAATADLHTMELLLRDLRVSTEHEGFTLHRGDLSKEELRHLKQLCQLYGLVLEVQPAPRDCVIVRRHLGPPTSYTGSTSVSAKPSPALKPISPGLRPSSLTPPLHPADCPITLPPGSMRPSWREQQQPTEPTATVKSASAAAAAAAAAVAAGSGSTLQIIRCQGEEGGGAPFPSGRGRPV